MVRDHSAARELGFARAVEAIKTHEFKLFFGSDFTMRRIDLLALAGALVILAAVPRSEACTGIELRPLDGSVLSGRTLEFALDLESSALHVPRGLAYAGSTPDGTAGLKWTTRFAAVGANAVGLPQYTDGLNERGLGVGLFYFPGYAKYQEVTAAAAGKVLAPWELGTYLLTTCETVDEAIKAAGEVVVAAVELEKMGFVPPVHYIVRDASGRSAVLEHIDGRLTVHENPIGVITNSPTFDWHLTNVRNYLNLSAVDVGPMEIGKLELAPFGRGSGLHGLPGDFTPPSRFIRARCWRTRRRQSRRLKRGSIRHFTFSISSTFPKARSVGLKARRVRSITRCGRASRI